jgi:hypothetical protein
MVDRRRPQVGAALSLVAEELAVVVGVARQGEDAQQFLADEQVIVDGQLAPRLDANAWRRRVMVAEGDVGLGQAAQRRSRQRLSPGVEDLDDRIHR